MVGELMILLDAAGCGQVVTCLMRDVHCAGGAGGPELAPSVSMITDAPQVPPVTAFGSETLQ